MEKLFRYCTFSMSVSPGSRIKRPFKGCPEKSVAKMYGSTLLALRGGGWGSNFQKKVLCNT